nr:16S rRNA (cytidine(1402)-2'-O)-methyltransferase [bacterium endosymbiont of Pedicinus badii]
MSDPGYILVRNCQILKIRVVPIPGPCSLIAAISASGMCSKRFCYEGFLPKKRNKRIKKLESIIFSSKTTIFFESKHRILETLQDIQKVFGKEKKIVLAKEISKIWEKIVFEKIINILEWIKKEKKNSFGEMIILIEANKLKNSYFPEKIIETFKILRKELSKKKAIKITAKIHREKKRNIYNFFSKK